MMMNARVMLGLVWGGLATGGCVLAKDIGGTPGDDSSSGSESASASSSAEGSSAEGSSAEGSSGGTPVCPQSPEFSCSAPLPCTIEGSCGAFGSFADADGCPRPRCSENTPCDDGLVCVRLGDIGSCSSSQTFCEDNELGECTCGGTDDCNADVSFCMPPAEAFPEACGILTDEASCLAAGCTAWVETASPEWNGDACLCESVGGTCVWFPDGEPEHAGDQIYLTAFEETPRFFFDAWVTPPFGWITCADGIEGVEECQCNDSPPLCI